MSDQLDLFLVRYPHRPGAKERGGSSEAAATGMEACCGPLQLAVLRVLRDHPDGLTADEIAGLCNCSILAIRPRVSELLVMRLVERTPKFRLNVSGCKARVWRAAT